MLTFEEYFEKTDVMMENKGMMDILTAVFEAAGDFGTSHPARLVYV